MAGIFVGLAFAVVVGIAVFFANERKLADNLRAQAEAEKALAAAEREQARRDAKEASDRLALAEKEGEAARTASARAIADKGAAEQARKDFFEAVKTVYSRAELEALKRKYGMQVNPPPAAGPKGQLVDATPW